jgi:hypothetical protein
MRFGPGCPEIVPKKVVSISQNVISKTKEKAGVDAGLREKSFVSIDYFAG